MVSLVLFQNLTRYIGKLLADGLIGDETPKQVDVLSEKIANLTGDLKGLYGQAEKQRMWRYLRPITIRRKRRWWEVH